MSLVDDDTVLRESDLEQMQGVTLGDPSAPEDSEPMLPGEAHGPTRLGHYVLLSKIGQGGMGVVFAAYDERLDRKVAIKLLRAASDGKAHKRLLREAQSMARLSHQNVAQVYEIATVGQLTFIVMEFINGQTLRAWLAAKPRSQRAILDVFIAAGRGLAAAHARNLVHRDFKPDNVMIRDDGQVVVMDFGLAHRETESARSPEERAHPHTEPSGLTATGALLGTPAYMAPEQFEDREIEPRTDQFSFCVALWEALYGLRPFVGISVMELSVAVCSGQITQPEQGEVPTWLRKVMERGLEVDPARRWPTLDELLDALRRDPTTRWRPLVFGSVAIALLLASLGAVHLAQARARAKLVDECEQRGQALIWNAEVEARLADAFERSGFGYAPSAWAHTRALLDDYARSWSAERTKVCVDVEIEQMRTVEEGGLIESCLDERRATFEGLIEGWAEIDEKTLARSVSAAARLPPPSSCTTELWLHERMQPPQPLHAEVDELRKRLDRVQGLHFAGKYEPALAQVEPILQAAEQLEWLPLIAEARLELGMLKYKLGDYETARVGVEKAYREAVAAGHDMAALNCVANLCANVGDKLASPERGLLWCELGSSYVARLGLGGGAHEAQVLDNLGAVHSRAGAFADAIAAHERARQIYESALGTNHMYVAAAINNIGSAQWNLGRNDEALASFRASLQIKQLVFGEQHPEVATTLNNVGAVTWSMGDYEQALDAFRRALALREAALGPTHPDVGSSLNNIGAVLASRGESAEALIYFRRALELQQQVLGAEHPDVAGALTNIGTILRKQGAYRESLETHRRAAAIWEKALGPEHPGVAVALNNVGLAHWTLNEYEEARATHLRALAIREKALGPEHADIAQSLDNLAEVAYRTEDLDEAIALNRRALAMREKLLGSEHPDVASSLDSLGDVLRAADQAEEALELHRRALRIGEAEFGADNWLLASTWLLLGLAQLELGSLDEARASLERAEALRAAQKDALPGELAEVAFALAMVRWEQGERDLALEQALAARPGLLETEGEKGPTLEKLDGWLRARGMDPT